MSRNRTVAAPPVKNLANRNPFYPDLPTPLPVAHEHAAHRPDPESGMSWMVIVFGACAASGAVVGCLAGYLIAVWVR